MHLGSLKSNPGTLLSVIAGQNPDKKNIVFQYSIAPQYQQIQQPLNKVLLTTLLLALITKSEIDKCYNIIKWKDK